MSNGQDPKTPPGAPAEDNGQPARGATQLKSLQALTRLRGRVEEAARELQRLRQENAALAERLRDLEDRPAADFEGAVLHFDDDPDALREQVEAFIATLDEYLAKESG